MHFFSDPEPPIIKILHASSGINDHFLLSSLLFSFVISSRLSTFVMYNNGSQREN